MKMLLREMLTVYETHRGTRRLIWKDGRSETFTESLWPWPWLWKEKRNKKWELKREKMWEHPSVHQWKANEKNCATWHRGLAMQPQFGRSPRVSYKLQTYKIRKFKQYEIIKCERSDSVWGRSLPAGHAKSAFDRGDADYDILHI